MAGLRLGLGCLTPKLTLTSSAVTVWSDAGIQMQALLGHCNSSFFLCHSPSFKIISEAYQTLTDPKKREMFVNQSPGLFIHSFPYRYDKYGTADEKEIDDPAMILKMLFGAGAFDDVCFSFIIKISFLF